MTALFFAFLHLRFHIFVSEWYLARGVDVTAVLQTRDRSVAKKTLAEDGNSCHSRTIAAEEEQFGLDLMKEAYRKYGSGSLDKTKGTDRVVVASYESLMKFKETYLLEIFDQLRINSEYASQLQLGNTKYPLTFTDENVKYIRTPPSKKKKSTTTIQRPPMSSTGGGVFGRIMSLHKQDAQIKEVGPRLGMHRKSSEENVRM